MAKLDEIEGIGPVYAKTLAKAGIQSTDALLKEGSTSKGRKDLAARSGLSTKQILEWVNHVDLFRVKGVGSEYADLLEAAGVDTVPELAQRSAANLYQKILEVNAAKKLVRRPPAESMIADWVKQAKKLPRIIQY